MDDSLFVDHVADRLAALPAAPPVWADRAHMTLGYARNAYAGSGRVTELAGALAISGAMAAHAVLAARGEWVPNEKRRLERAGLRDMDEFVIGLQAEPSVLEGIIDQATHRFSDAITKAAPKSARKGGPEG